MDKACGGFDIGNDYDVYCGRWNVDYVLCVAGNARICVIVSVIYFTLKNFFTTNTMHMLKID